MREKIEYLFALIKKISSTSLIVIVMVVISILSGCSEGKPIEKSSFTAELVPLETIWTHKDIGYLLFQYREWYTAHCRVCFGNRIVLAL